jgi:hypothetical protein
MMLKELRINKRMIQARDYFNYNKIITDKLFLKNVGKFFKYINKCKYKSIHQN